MLFKLHQSRFALQDESKVEVRPEEEIDQLLTGFEAEDDFERNLLMGILPVEPESHVLSHFILSQDAPEA